MKKISLILGIVILSGCAMGINQSVAVINSKPYLVEKKTYVSPILPIAQWSDELQITPLEILTEEEQSSKETLRQIVAQCEKQSSFPAIVNCIKNKTK